MSSEQGEKSQALFEDSLNDINVVRKYAKFLHANIPLREAVQVSKRVNYFRGKKLYEVLLDSTIVDKSRPASIETKEQANMVGLALLKQGLIHASEVANKKKRELRPINAKEFDEEGYYTWIYEGSKTMRNVLLGLLVFSITAMCMFPVWPASAKVGIWYVSVTLLIFLFVLFFVRLVVYLLFWTLGFEFWILPNFFDEDLGVLDSFKPLVSFNRAGDIGQTWFLRAAGFALFVSFGMWCYQQNPDFDEIYAAQMDFIAELYDGKLLQDPSKEEALRERAIPDLEELKKQYQREQQGLDPEEEDDEQGNSAQNDGVDQDEDDEEAVLDSLADDDDHPVEEELDI